MKPANSKKGSRQMARCPSETLSLAIVERGFGGVGIQVRK
jgi:hypothetical protein